MKLEDYVLGVDGLDWAAVVPEWEWLVPSGARPVLMTRFGDVFLSSHAGSVHLLDLENGTCDRYSDGGTPLLERIAADRNCSDLLLTPLVDLLVANGVALASRSCYHFKIPTVLGGNFNTDNITAIDVSERIRFCGDLHRQIKDLPDGSPVKLQIMP